MPVTSPVSGLYDGPAKPVPLGPAPVGTRPIRREVIRLDVDGRYPQMTVSGYDHRRARLADPLGSAAAADRAEPIPGIDLVQGRRRHVVPVHDRGRDRDAELFPAERRVRIVFSGGGAAKRTVEYSFTSGYFRTVNFEFDVQTGEVLDTAIDTCAHPIRPAGLACESLSIQTVYRRVGCQVTTSPPSIVGAAPGGTWSDMEMHDAMQVHWSRFANTAQWAMWVFFAALHESGTGLGGIMYDDLGPNHRQGTALFLDSFIANPPSRDPNPDAWRDRMRFWTAVHEMGHAFNLAHSWQKAGASGWVPLANEPEARSFMNYPYNVAGGQNAFWSDFPFRFSDPELLFIRHAPERFVQMGNADWFDHHGFEEARIEEGTGFALELRVNREQARYEFMEPVWIELKLTNVAEQPQLVDANTLDADSLTIVLKKDRAAARQLVPFRQKCVEPEIDGAAAGRVALRHGARLGRAQRLGRRRAGAVHDPDGRARRREPMSSRSRSCCGSRRRSRARRSTSRATCSRRTRHGRSSSVGRRRSAARTTCSPRSSTDSRSGGSRSMPGSRSAGR